MLYQISFRCLYLNSKIRCKDNRICQKSERRGGKSCIHVPCFITSALQLYILCDICPACRTIGTAIFRHCQGIIILERNTTIGQS